MEQDFIKKINAYGLIVHITTDSVKFYKATYLHNNNCRRLILVLKYHPDDFRIFLGTPVPCI